MNKKDENSNLASLTAGEIATLPWGPQGGGWFIRKSRPLSGDVVAITTLEHNRCSRVKVYTNRFGGSWIERAWTPEEGLAFRRAQKRARAEQQSEYLKRLDQVVQALEMGSPVLFRDGAMGGAFSLPTWPEGEVSARGACRRAGIPHPTDGGWRLSPAAGAHAGVLSAVYGGEDTEWHLQDYLEGYGPRHVQY